MSQSKSLFTNVLSASIIRIVRVVLQVFITPLVIILLGVEQYGLITFGLTLQMAFTIFDIAMSPAIIREFGIMDSRKENTQRMWNLFYSFERLSFFIAMFIAAFMILLAPWISENWLQAKEMDRDNIAMSVRLIGLLIAFQWPSLLYGSCFVGLHRQSIMARITVVILSLQTIIALSVIYFIKADIVLYLAIQAFFAFVMSFFMRQYIIKTMPPSESKPKFDIALLKSIRKFAGGTFIIGLTTIVLTQTDKIFIAKWVTLDVFAVYALSFTVVSQIAAILFAPLMVSIQPVMARLMNSGDHKMATQEYHRFTQINALINFTCLGALAFFITPLLTIWLGASSPMIEPVAKLVPWIVLGSILNSLSSMLYIVQMAVGWVKLKIIMNISLAILFLIAFFFGFPIYGMMIGPILWVALNVAYIFIEAPILHSKHLKGEYFRWLTIDIALPAVIAFTIFMACRLYMPVFDSLWLEFIKICFSASLVGVALLCVLPLARHTIVTIGMRFIRNLRT